MHIVKQYAEVGFMTVFARIMRYGTDKQLLRKDSEGKWSYIGGKEEEGETDLYGQVLEGELGEEARATLNPANFGSPDYNLNCILAHHTPLVFANDMEGNRIIRDPAKYAHPVKVRVVFLMYEVSGNIPPAGKRNLGFREFKAVKAHPTRESVRYTEKIFKGNWRWGHLKAPNVDFPYSPNLGQLRKELLNLGIHPDEVEKYAPSRTRSFHLASPPQVTDTVRAAVA